MDAREDARKALQRLCELHGFTEAAEVLRAKCSGGVITLAPHLADSRDGREEAIDSLKDAFDGDPRPIIVIGPIA